MSKKPKVDPHSPFAKLEKLREEMVAEKTASKAPSPKGAVGKGAKASPAPPPASAPSAKGAPRASGRAATSLPESAESTYEFHRLVAGVTPLGEGKKARVPRSIAAEPGVTGGAEREALKARAEEAARTEDEAVHAHLRALIEGGASRFEVIDDGRRVEGRRIDVPPATVRALRRGLLPVDARTDLHGLRAGEAHEALATFLRDQRVRGERCVLVVHGKGAHSPGGAGVLRGEISAWLSQGKASDHVAAFATAVDDDGGEGAVYVLLRR